MSLEVVESFLECRFKFLDRIAHERLLTEVGGSRDDVPQVLEGAASVVVVWGVVEVQS